MQSDDLRLLLTTFPRRVERIKLSNKNDVVPFMHCGQNTFAQWKANDFQTMKICDFIKLLSLVENKEGSR